MLALASFFPFFILHYIFFLVAAAVVFCCCCWIEKSILTWRHSFCRSQRMGRRVPSECVHTNCASSRPLRELSSSNNVQALSLNSRKREREAWNAKSLTREGDLKIISEKWTRREEKSLCGVVSALLSMSVKSDLLINDETEISSLSHEFLASN